MQQGVVGRDVLKRAISVPAVCAALVVCCAAGVPALLHPRMSLLEARTERTEGLIDVTSITVSNDQSCLL